MTNCFKRFREIISGFKKKIMGRYDPRNEIIYNEGISDDIIRITDLFDVSNVEHDKLANNYMDNYYSKEIIDSIEIEKCKYSNEYFNSVVTDFINPLIKANLKYFKNISNNTLDRIKSWLLDKLIVSLVPLKGVEVSTEEYVSHKYYSIYNEFREIEESPKKLDRFENQLRKELSSYHWESFRHIWHSYKEGKMNRSDLFSKGFETVREEDLKNGFDRSNILVRYDFANKDKAEYNKKLKQQSDLIHGKSLSEQIKLPNEGVLEAISPDGALFLCKEKDILHIIDLKKRELVESLPSYHFFTCSFSYDNKYIVFVHPLRMFLWHIKKNEMIWNIDSERYKKERNFYAKITPDNRYVVSTGDYITVRDVDTSKKIWSIENDGIIFVISNDSKYIIKTAYEKIDVRDLHSGELVKSLFFEEDGKKLYESFFYDGIAISHNNKYIAGSFSQFDIETSAIWEISGNFIRILDDEEFENEDDLVGLGLKMEFSYDDKYLAITDTSNKAIKLWDLSTGTRINKLKHEYEINSIKFIPNTNFLLSSTFNGSIFFWDYLFNV